MVAGVADRVQVMYAGEVVETGSIVDVFNDSRHPYTLGLLASLPRLDADEDARLEPIRGNPPNLLRLPRGCAFHPRCPLAEDVCRSEEPALREVGPDRWSRCFFAERIGDEVPA